MFNKKWALFALLIVLGAVVLAACQPATEQVEVVVTRVVTETVVEEGETVEVTRVITETVVETVEVEAEPEEEMASPKDLIVCMAQEPDTLYEYGGDMLAATNVKVAIFTQFITNFSFGYQADGLVKVPSLADGDAVINSVEVNAGDMVVDSSGELVELADGVSVKSADGEIVEFDGTPVMLEQMVVDFEMLPMSYSDGTAVTAADSVYSWNLIADPDTPRSKFVTDRTASYEATGDLSTRWTGLPGYIDSTYFANFAVPFPEHLWGGFSAAELLEAEESSRLPVGHGAFKIEEWNAGESMFLTPNEFYWREGLPYLDSLTYKFIPDTNQLTAQLIAGSCDIGTQDASLDGQSEFLIEAEANGLLTAQFVAGTVWEHIDFGINPEPGYAATRPDWFEDVRVRQAMLMCTDRQSMVDAIFFGRSEVIHSYIPSIHPLYPSDGLTEWPYDPAAANALLDEAGFADTDGDGIREFPAGTPFAPTLGTTSGNDARQQLTQITKENMLECGIDVQLYYLPSSEWFADGPDGPLFGTRFDLGEFAWLTGVEPPCDLYMTNQIPTADNAWAGQNQTGFTDEEYDAACLKAITSLPGTADYEEGHKEAQILFSEKLPVMPLYLRIIVAAARPNVVGFTVDPTQSAELTKIYEIDLAP